MANLSILCFLGIFNCIVLRNSVGTEAYVAYVEQFEAWERDVDRRREMIRAKAEAEAQEALVLLFFASLLVSRMRFFCNVFNEQIRTAQHFERFELKFLH